MRALHLLVILGLLALGCRDRAAPREPPAPRREMARTGPKAPVPKPIAAIGDQGELSPAERRALDPADHAPRPEPGPGDWLAAHPERGQTFAQYERSSPNRPDERRRVLYLLPLGELPAERTPPLEDLAALVAAFFQLEVRILPAVDLATAAATRRTNDDTGKPQVLAPDLLRWLTLQVPRDAYALMAVTMTDLYPEPSWNFVYGQATLTERVGVQSFARYDPAFFGKPRPDDWRRTLTRRSAQVLVHELAHMFGLPHCVHWSCVVAGANHQAEFDAHPLHPCPVCLRKLWWNIGFDLGAREAALAVAWRRLGLDDEAAWSEARARAIADAR
jgi:archaemetzincin